MLPSFRILILSMLLAINFFIANSYAQQQSSASTVIDKNRIYTVAYAEDSYPYYFTKDGKAEGLIIDLWRHFESETGIKLKFVSLNYEQAIEKISLGEIDFHAGLIPTAERSKQIHIEPSSLSAKSYFYLSYRMRDVRSISGLKPFTIGAVESSVESDYIKSNYPWLAIKHYPNKGAMYKAALAEDILAFADDNEGDRLYFEYTSLRKLYPLANRLTLLDRKIGIGTSLSDPHLIAIAKIEIQRSNSKSIKGLERKWHQYNNDSSAVTLGYTPNNAPYMAQDSKGEAQGIFIDLWRAWAKKNNQKVEFIAVSRQEALSLVQNQLLDFHAGIAFAKGNEEYYSRIFPIYSAIAQVYVAKKNNHIKVMSDLSGHRLGIYDESPYLKSIQQRYPEIELVKFFEVKRMIKAEREGEITAFIASVDVIETEIRKANLNTVYRRLLSPRYDIHFDAISNIQNEDLINLFNNDQIPSDEERQIIADSWLEYDQSLLLNSSDYMADLSSEQIKFLSKKSQFDVGILDSYKPFEFLDNGEPKGIHIDILNLIAQRTGVEFNYKFYPSWNLLYSDYLNNKTDLILGMTPTKDRKGTMHFTKEYMSIPWGVIGRNSLNDEIDNVDSLHGYKVAIPYGYKAIDYLHKYHPQIQLTIVDTIEEGAKLLTEGEIDLYIDFHPVLTNMVIDYSINTFGIRYLTDIPPELNHIAINNKYDQLAAILNKGINNISAADMDNIRDFWLRSIIKEGLDRDTVVRTSLQVGFIVLFVVACILFWAYKMRTEVNIRRVLEEKLRHTASHDLLTGLANRGLFAKLLSKNILLHKRQEQILAVLFIDIDGFKAVNDSFGHNVGDELLIEIGRILQSSVRESDLVSRFGGDEFLLLLNNIHNIEGATTVAQKIINLLSTPIQLKDHQVNIGASIGISIYPNDGTSEEQLIEAADTLMYKVKSTGKNSYLLNDLTPKAD